jgi:hypothetical protein
MITGIITSVNPLTINNVIYDNGKIIYKGKLILPNDCKIGYKVGFIKTITELHITIIDLIHITSSIIKIPKDFTVKELFSKISVDYNNNVLLGLFSADDFMHRDRKVFDYCTMQTCTVYLTEIKRSPELTNELNHQLNINRTLELIDKYNNPQSSSYCGLKQGFLNPKPKFNYNICNQCNIKLSLVDKMLKCKCGFCFCILHRHYLKHNCKYDYNCK